MISKIIKKDQIYKTRSFFSDSEIILSFLVLRQGKERRGKRRKILGKEKYFVAEKKEKEKIFRD